MRGTLCLSVFVAKIKEVNSKLDNLNEIIILTLMESIISIQKKEDNCIKVVCLCNPKRKKVQSDKIH